MDRRSFVYCLLLFVCSVWISCQGAKIRGNEIQVDFPFPGDVTPVEDDDVDTCVRQMARVYRTDAVTSYPPDLSGEWTSSRCEVRPGPEFLLRKYRFFRGSRFTLTQFYYSDATCRTPVYTLVARGSYSIFQASWLLPGAADVEYVLNHVSVVAHSDKMAALLAGKVNRTCPGHVGPHGWRRDHAYDIFTYEEVAPPGGDPDEDGYLVSDRDCLDALSFTAHELQLLRLETRPGSSRPHADLLYLGDVHTAPDQRRSYRPTAFQEPLRRQYTHHGCGVCQAVEASDEYNPPSLHRHDHHHHRQQRESADLAGSWFSETCEARPNGIFLTRHLSFAADNRTWEGYYHHFLDSACQRPQFTVYVKGKFAFGGPSPVIAGAYNVDFQVLRARVKPTDKAIVLLLNQQAATDDRCGDRGEWTLDDSDDVTTTSGCPALGVALPHVESEIVKLEREHGDRKLYLGQRPTDGAVLSLHERPTSFQAPLVRCSSDVEAITPAYRFHAVVGESSGAPSVRPGLLVSTLLTLLVCLVVGAGRMDTMD